MVLMQAGSLSDFYENCRGLELARNFQFPTLREVRFCASSLYFNYLYQLLGKSSHLSNFPQPPQTFLVTMEEYVRDAPRMVPVRDPLVST
jgi:hypothetical protein